MKWPWSRRPTETTETVIIGAPSGPGELDPLSQTWLAVDEYIRTDIEKLRDKNESVTADPIKTAYIRGQIKALRDVLTLANPKRRGFLAPDNE